MSIWDKIKSIGNNKIEQDSNNSDRESLNFSNYVF